MSDTKDVDQESNWTPEEIAGYVGIMVLTLAFGAIVIIAAVRGAFSGVGGILHVVGIALAGIVVAVMSVAVYILPTLIASRRKMPHTGSIAVINLLLGFTYVGWVVALAVAVADKRD